MGNLYRKRRKERASARRQASSAWEAAEAGSMEKAEKLIREAVKSRSGDCVLWNDLGLILWRRSKLREAEKALRNALSLRPDYEEAKMNLASLLESRGFYRQALRLEEEMAGGESHQAFHQRRVEELRRAIQDA